MYSQVRCGTCSCSSSQVLLFHFKGHIKKLISHGFTCPPIVELQCIYCSVLRVPGKHWWQLRNQRKPASSSAHSLCRGRNFSRALSLGFNFIPAIILFWDALHTILSWLTHSETTSFFPAWKKNKQCYTCNFSFPFLSCTAGCWPPLYANIWLQQRLCKQPFLLPLF